MRVRLFRWGEALFGSYWFVPALMALAAVVLSFAAVGLDVYLGTGWLDPYNWLLFNEAEGARGLLSTIAGSMITVAGVTFSITIATVAQTTSQFGPRLVTNFMQDRGNQITLGTFIATFLYCLLVLRTVRDGEGDELFVPHIAVFGGLLLGVASLSVLIYFFHHVPESIHISNVVARLGRELHRRLDHLFPKRLGRDADEVEDRTDGRDAPWPERFDREAVPIAAHGNGYVQFVDEDGLMAHAREHDLVLRILRRPGSFVSEERVLALAWPRHRVGDGGEDHGVAAGIQRCFALGGYRSPAQDVGFHVDRLIEIAARALSPGMNDLFTATNAMDWLGSGLSNLAGREIPSACRYDEDGVLRVIAESVSFAGIADEVFDRLRPYVQNDLNAALHLLKVIGEVARDARTGEQRRVLRCHATALWDACEAALTRTRDLAAVREAYHAVLRRPDHEDGPAPASGRGGGAAAQR